MANNYENLKTSTIYTGAPFAYLYEINEGTGAIGEKWAFNTVTTNKITLPKSGSSSSSTDYNEITLADGLVLATPKVNRKILATTGEDKTESTSTSYATSKGKFELSIVGAPYMATQISPTEWLQLLNAKHDALFMAAAPLGYSIKNMPNTASEILDGWIYMFARITNDYEFTASTDGSPISLTLESNSFAGTDANKTTLETALIATGIFTAIPHIWNTGSTAPLTVTAPDLVAAEASTLTSGNVVIKKPTA